MKSYKGICIATAAALALSTASSAEVLAAYSFTGATAGSVGPFTNEALAANVSVSSLSASSMPGATFTNHLTTTNSSSPAYTFDGVAWRATANLLTNNSSSTTPPPHFLEFSIQVAEGRTMTLNSLTIDFGIDNNNATTGNTKGQYDLWASINGGATYARLGSTSTVDAAVSSHVWRNNVFKNLQTSSGSPFVFEGEPVLLTHANVVKFRIAFSDDNSNTSSKAVMVDDIKLNGTVSRLTIAADSPHQDFNFGNQFVTDSPYQGSRTVTYVNSGPGAIDINSVSLPNDGGGTFALPSLPSLPLTLAVDETLSIEVAASSETKDTLVTGSLSIETNDTTQNRTLPLSVRHYLTAEVLNSNPTLDSGITGWRSTAGGTAVQPGLGFGSRAGARVKGVADPAGGEPDSFGQVVPTGASDWELAFLMATPDFETWTEALPFALDRTMQLAVHSATTFPSSADGLWNDSHAASSMINLAYFPTGNGTTGEGFYLFDGVASQWVHVASLGTISPSVDANKDGILNAATGDTVNTYLVRIKGTDFGKPSANYTVSVSSANTLNSSVTSGALTVRDQSPIVSNTPAGYVFTTGDTSTSTGSWGALKSSFWVDEISYWAGAAAVRENIAIQTEASFLVFNQASGTSFVTVRNNGLSGNLSIPSVFSSNPVFSVVDSLPIIVPPYTTRDITVQFNTSNVPASVVESGSIVFTTDAPRNPEMTATLTGRVIRDGDSLISNGEFDSSPFLSGWTTKTNSTTAFDGLVTDSTTSVDLKVGFTEALQQAFDPAAADFTTDFYVAIRPVADPATQRQLHFMIGSSANGYILNVRYQNGKFQTFNGVTWVNLLTPSVPLAASIDANLNGSLNDPEDTKNIYRIRVVGTGFGTPSASWSFYVSAANSSSFVDSVTGLSLFHAASPTSNLAARLVFDTNFGGNPGYWVDSVAVTYGATPVISTPAVVTVTGYSGGPGGFTIQWSTTPAGASCKVRRSTDMTNWTDVSTGNSTGSYFDAGAPADRAFYQVIVE
jgi:hypothetical protein